MARPEQPKHFVVDGSNIATEGRNMPSLAQLNEAVLAFMEDHPGVLITVVVDATFGHRIDSSEVKAFDEAVANNELVAPPAGAIGRGDAFVLTIANKAKAGVLSNDSFQEFHGEYGWLFEEGRLIGGKPVPNVGWVFVPRSPVRGPKSRRAVREANDVQAEKHRTAVRVRRKPTEEEETFAQEETSAPATPTDLRERAAAIVAAGTAPVAKDYVNDLGAYLEFAGNHPVGSTVEAVVDRYSSHGAYATVDGVSVYVPLRLMDDPPPPGARKAMQLGSTHELVVVAYVPERRSIDAARPHVAGKALPEGTEIVPLGGAKPAKTTRPRKRAAAPIATEIADPLAEQTDQPPAADTEVAAEPVKPVRKRASKAPAKTAEGRPEPAESEPPLDSDAPAAPEPALARRAAKQTTKRAPATEPEPPAEDPPKPVRKRAAKKTAATADGETSETAGEGAAAPRKRATKKAVAKPAKKAAAEADRTAEPTEPTEPAKVTKASTARPRKAGG